MSAGEIGRACAGGRAGGDRDPRREIAQVGEIVKGWELGGTAIGPVALDEIVTGARIEPGDAVIGLPSSGLHSNGYTLARRALGRSRCDDRRRASRLGDVLLEPTEIYVRRCSSSCGSDVDVRGLAHITGDGLNNLLRLADPVGYEIDDPLPVPPVFGLIQELGGLRRRDARGLQHGLGFVCVVPGRRRDGAWSCCVGTSPRRRGSGGRRRAGGSGITRSPAVHHAYEDRRPDLRPAHGPRRDRPLRGALAPARGRASFVARRPGPKRTDTGSARAQRRPRAGRGAPDPEILLVPGGEGKPAADADDRVLEWLRWAHETRPGRPRSAPARLCSAPPGSSRASARPPTGPTSTALSASGAEPVAERVVEDGKMVTAAGVSAGIDMALTLAAQIAGEEVAKAIQLGIEYDPDPPSTPARPRRRRRSWSSWSDLPVARA